MGAALKLNRFEIVPAEKYLLVQLFGETSPESAVEFNVKVSSSKLAGKGVVIDCAHAQGLHDAWIDVLAAIEVSLRSSGHQLRLANVSLDLLKAIQTNVLAQTLQISASLDAAVQEVAAPKPKQAFDADFLNPFLIATISVLETQASTKAKTGKIFRRAAGESFLGEISGVISVVTESFAGTFVISFPAQTYLKILSRMLGEECLELNAENSDGVGELTNIIFGQAKVALNQRGFSIQKALPVVLYGADQLVSQVTKSPRLIVPFETDVGAFSIEVGLPQ
jgi:chemotaxis protein CheX